MGKKPGIWKEIIISLCTSVMLSLSFPPFEMPIFAWIAFVPLFSVIKDKHPSRAFFIGLISGFLFYCILMYWLVETMEHYGNINIVLSILIFIILVIYLSLYWAVFTFTVSRFMKDSSTMIFAPPLWVMLEYLRAHIFTGFPWELLGYSQFSNLTIVQIADITGPYGLSFLIMFFNTLIYEMIANPSRERKPFFIKAASVFVILYLLVYAYGKYALSKYDKFIGPYSVSIIQGNIDQSLKWDKKFRQSTINIYERLTMGSLSRNPDLIVWPETAAPFLYNVEKEYRNKIEDIVKRSGRFLLTGSPSVRVEGDKVELFNSAFLIDPSGSTIEQYDKIHLVPFGEYVPLKRILFFIKPMVEAAGDFKSGSRYVVFDMDGKKFSVIICFEAIFPELCRRFVKAGAEFLINITNDAWFGKTSAPYQHLSMVTFRAIENRVFIVRAANTGISAIINPAGRILASTDLFKEAILTGGIDMRKEYTIYSRWGDVFAWICICLFSYTMIKFLRIKSGGK